MTQEARPQHQTREQYDGFRSALIDAHRVAGDVVEQVAGEMLVPASEVDFLARRLRDLTRLCLDSLPADLRPADQQGEA